MTKSLSIWLIAKLARGAVTVFGILTIVFFALRMTGDPTAILLGPEATTEMRSSMAAELGLDRSLIEQYAVFVTETLHGQFGRSYIYQREAIDVVLEHIPATIQLSGMALLISIVIGIASGVMSALLHNTTLDSALTSVGMITFSVPNFFMAVLLIHAFSVWIPLLPTSGFGTWRHAVLPTATIAAVGWAVVAKFTRGALLDVLGSPYLAAANARRIPYWRIVVHHALPNAMIPILTILGLMMGGVITGAIVVETVFAWPGMGRLFVTSVANRDLPIVQAITMIAAFAMIASNLIVDLCYYLVDPRLRTSK